MTATVKWGLAVSLALVAIGSGLVHARSEATPGSRSPSLSPSPSPSSAARSAAQEQTPYNGKFVFVRLRYNSNASGLGGFGRRRRGGDGWFHDYPDAERNITRLIANITSVKPGVEGGNIIDVGDPELMKYPIAYLSEPGNGAYDRTSGGWDMNDQETANMRAYLLKGGFLIVDDFPYPAWGNFETQMRRMLPELQPIQLAASHPIFHSFFSMESLDHLYGSNYMREKPIFVGYFEDNDPKKRLLVIANFQNDLGERWEFAELGFSFVGDEATSESYKFGVNYIIYGLTH